MERKHATKYEAEALTIQEQLTKAEARAKIFEMMDKQSTKSEADLIKKEELHDPVKSNRKRYF